MATCVRSKRHLAATISLILLLLSLAGNALADTRERPTVAVVLGGGSARGLSHIGLLRALAENGIPVDMLVGTSMGSLVAGMYAAGLSVDNLTYLVTTVDLGLLFEPLLPPRGGLVGAERFERFIDLLTDTATFEQLPIPFYAVVTHLESGREVVWTKGKISRGMLASMSIPGAFPPVELDGEYYVDGGVASMVPVQAARRLGADVVIAVDVRGRRTRPVDPENALEVLDAVLTHMLEANADAQLALADVVVFPDVPADAGLEYDRAEDFIAAGYEAALAAIPQIRARLLELDPDFPFGSKPPPAGWPADVFAARVAEALSIVTADVHLRQLAALPSLDLRSNQPSRLQLGFDVNIGRLGRQPALALYSLHGTAAGWVHTLGLGFGTCRGACGAVFVRHGHGDGSWSPGLRLEGLVGDSHYTLEWESRANPTQPGWRAALMFPVTTEALVQGRQLVVHVQQDPRGLYGAPAGHVQAETLYRWYSPAEKRNLLRFLRGATHLYAGVGAAFTMDGSRLLPVLEAGVVSNTYLFGLRPFRLRVALTYRGSEVWGLHISLGE
ncbi:MAG TPA: patatin-like phospholipase family protein [Limnochordales bacterium]